MSHDIFISYSRHDTERMQQVRDGLREAGLAVWTDEGIEPGTESWKTALSNAITGCTSVVVLFSPDAAQSTWVNRELDFAELHKKKIYPLLVRGEPKDALPFGYTTFQFIDIRNDDALENGLQELVSILSKEFPSKTLSAKSHPQVPDSVQSDENAFQAVERASEKEETLWKWIETPRLHFTVPSSWKVSEATHENWARASLLMLEDEVVFYKQLEIEQAAPSRIIGIPRLSFERHQVLTDITGLEPVGGYMAFIKSPFILSPFALNPIVNIMTKRFNKLAKEVAHWEMIDNYWLPHSHTRTLVINMKRMSDQHDNKGRYYILIPSFSNYLLMINIACATKRFEKEQADYHRIARSIQLLPQQNWDN